MLATTQTNSTQVENAISGKVLGEGNPLVTEVRHWTNNLFSFRIQRPKGFRFRSGEFVMIGLSGGDGRPLIRAYSIASANWDEELEFYSIIVPDGPLTSRLANIQVGDEIILRPKSTGTLVLDALTPAKRLFLFSTGTGFAPFASILRDPETYNLYDQIVVTHTCRKASDLIYSQSNIADVLANPLIGEEARTKLLSYETVTQDHHENVGRITEHLKTGEIFKKLNIQPINVETDRAMICGSMGLNKDLKSILEDIGMKEGSNSLPRDFVIEKSFVG